MTEEPKVCVDRVLSSEEAFEAARLAIEENPENLPVAVVHPGLGVAPPTPLELALVAGKKWKVGRTLTIGFLDGEADVQDVVGEIAREWCQHANLDFEFGAAADADIRISFQHSGSWSYIGTDAKTIASNQPTMNYGWLTPTTPYEEYQRVVRHEFGHALGCIHEHQNPAGNIPWDKEA
ncbi:MAG: Tolloid-like protein 1, partial [Actinobacteria bacterium]|nr:Tolloid-like protein 1 [Actinomycetota bacterium]